MVEYIVVGQAVNYPGLMSDLAAVGIEMSVQSMALRLVEKI